MAKWLTYIVAGACMFLWGVLPDGAWNGGAGRGSGDAVRLAGRAMPAPSAMVRCAAGEALPQVGECGLDGMGCALHPFPRGNGKGIKPAGGQPDATVRGSREGLTAGALLCGRHTALAVAAPFVRTGRYYVFALRRILV